MVISRSRNAGGGGNGRRLAAGAACLLFAALALAPAKADTDRFQLALNYVFTGQVDPSPAPEIVDRAACVVVLFDTKFQRYVRYYLRRFKMDVARTSKVYSGQQVSYILEVEGDDPVVDYLNPDKTTVFKSFKTEQIPLPGNIDQTQKALQIIFADYCKADKPKLPF